MGIATLSRFCFFEGMNKDVDRKINHLAMVATAFLVGGLAVGVAVYHLNCDWETRAQVGDMFGSVNAVFSGGALFGLILTIALQTRQLAMQAQELALQREEITKATKAQEESARALDAQTKVQMLTLQMQALNESLKTVAKEIEDTGGSGPLRNREKKLNEKLEKIRRDLESRII